MAVEALISIDEYLASAYEPDRDYVDGQLEERNVGEWNHAKTQLKIGAYLLAHYGASGIEVATELRVRVQQDRVRIPDVCVFLENPGERVPTKPPFVCIEVISPEDRMSRLETRISDYLNMGVAYVWVVDPETRQAYTATAAEGLCEIKDGVLRTADPPIELPLSKVFE